ncbi:DUF6527 family protein [Klebsiella pneumoniae]|uniref:DUF6527 family protein n=1 Tax=Klebsiella pneumoniae TaxID=573 RepID=UPI0022300394|nr:DUF6527 family protein [Klebsiella pneumoniae]MDM9245074.1 DUF6527 family protein [Klebsiella pneumoniae]
MFISAVVKNVSHDRLSFICPGCGFPHQVTIGQGEGPRWDWNHDYVRPTFNPSILVTWEEPSDNPAHFDDRTKDLHHICHSFVRDGLIQYLADCTHELAGQTVPLSRIGE